MYSRDLRSIQYINNEYINKDVFSQIRFQVLSDWVRAGSYSIKFNVNVCTYLHVLYDLFDLNTGQCQLFVYFFNILWGFL